MKQVLVTGAAGGVGHRVCAVLGGHGFQVRGLVRPEDDTRWLDLQPEELCVGYIQDRACVQQAMEGVDVVVHCAALLPDAHHADRSDFQEVNVEGTRHVMEEAIAHETPWVITMSTISVVDHVSRTVTASELFDYAPNPAKDPYLESKIAAEQMLRQMRARYRGELAILRLAYVYGPGNLAVWNRPLRLLRDGKFRLIGSGAAPFPLIYADDIGKYILALLQAGNAGGHDGVHILASLQQTTLRHVFDFAADCLRVRHPASVPVWIAQAGAAIAGTMPRSLRSGRFAMLTRARVQQFSRGYDLSAVLDRQMLGALEMMDYREGLQRMLADYMAMDGRK